MKKCLILLPAVVLLAACNDQKEQKYEGQSRHWNQQAVPLSLQCAACHAKEFEDWAGSDHAWAWRQIDPALDSEPFRGQSLTAHGSKLLFRTNRAGTMTLHDEESGQSFPVHSVLGRTPLVQYLVEGERGSFHTPSAAWDVTKREWFDMFEDDSRLSAEGNASRQLGDWGHWLGRGMNWNSQCAWCHMSGFRKNYDGKTDTYNSTWQEPGVTCIQCHKLAPAPDPEDGCMVAREDRTLTPKQIHDNCATCHARREEFDDSFTVGDAFDDHFRLELPTTEGIFWPNGMQRDEDYCETGLRHSRMGNTGVTCIECHDPHTAQLKLPQEDNSLCQRCHASGTEVNGVAAPIIDMATHTPCPQGSTGARCVECHMPISPYMARDPRRDHSFNSPDPLLSGELGIPNACVMCHTDKDNAWAAAAVEKTYGQEPKMARYRNRTRAVHAAMQGHGDLQALMAAYREEEVAAWRATLLELMAREAPTAEVLELARAAAKDPSAMVRAAAARVLGAEAVSLIHDPVKLVRRAAGWPLVDTLAQAPGAEDVMRELESTAMHQSDQPTGAMQLAILAEVRQDKAEAERQYRRAIQLDPVSYVARMDFAVFLAKEGRPVEALQQMLDCAKRHPQNAEVQYRLALILAELNQFQAALTALDKALALEPDFVRALYNRAQLLQFLNRPEEAARDLLRCRELSAQDSVSSPAQPEPLQPEPSQPASAQPEPSQSPPTQPASPQTAPAVPESQQ